MILFSDRLHYEKLFEEYCKNTGTVNCPMNFIAWLQSTQEGKSLVIRLYSETIENLVNKEEPK